MNAKDVTNHFLVDHWQTGQRRSRFTPADPQEQKGPGGMFASIIVLGLIVTACLLVVAFA